MNEDNYRTTFEIEKQANDKHRICQQRILESCSHDW